MFNWIKKHKVFLVLISLAVLFALVGIPLIINLLFKFNCGISMFQAEWSAGEALGYYGSVLSFVGTVVLGALALYQNHIIKEEANNRSLELENRDRLENMPKFSMAYRLHHGFGERIRFSISNLSRNISYEIKVYNIRILSDSHILWKTDATYKKSSLNSDEEFVIDLDSPEINSTNHFVLLANMSCKDKYNERHEYKLKIHCSKPNLFICDDIVEISSQ